jgi:O-antigen/teichoic acid export membrane protein
LLDEHIKKFLPSRKNAKDSLITLSGDFVSKGLLFLVNLVLMKYSSIQDFGLFSIYVTFLGLGQQFSDFGINQGIIKYYSLYKKQNFERANSFLDLGFKIKLVLAFSLSLIYLLLAYPTAIYVYTDIHITPLFIAAIGTVGASLLDFIQSVFQAKQDYRKMAITKILEGSLKLSGLLLLFVLKEFTIVKTFWIYSIVPIIVFLIAYTMYKPVKISYDKKDIFTELYSFSKWVFLASLTTMIMVRLDILMLSIFNVSDFAGIAIYSAGFKLCVPLQVTVLSMVTVFFPKAMEIKGKSEAKAFIFSTLKVTLPLTISFIFFSILVKYFVPVVFPNYVESLPIFYVLVFANILNLIGNPITIIIFAINQQKKAVMINVIQLFINILANLILYYYFSMIGIAFGTLITFVVGAILSSYYILQYLRK